LFLFYVFDNCRLRDEQQYTITYCGRSWKNYPISEGVKYVCFNLTAKGF